MRLNPERVSHRSLGSPRCGAPQVKISGSPRTPPGFHNSCCLDAGNCGVAVEPRRGSNGPVRFFLGCAVATATPGCVVEPRWGSVCHEKKSRGGAVCIQLGVPSAPCFSEAGPPDELPFSSATLSFLSLVAARPPKVAVGFNPRSAITTGNLVAERRLYHRHAFGRPMDACHRPRFNRRSATHRSRIFAIRALKPTATISRRSATGGISDSNSDAAMRNAGSTISVRATHQLRAERLRLRGRSGTHRLRACDSRRRKCRACVLRALHESGSPATR